MFTTLKNFVPASVVLSGLSLIALGAGLAGCTKERVVDVKTPVGGATVDRDRSTGAVDVNVDVGNKRPAAPAIP